MIGVGLMCGTSLDGIDVARVDIRLRAGALTAKLLDFLTVPLESALCNRIVVAHESPLTALDVALLHADIGDAFAAAAIPFATRCDFIASHGITLAHDGPSRITLQLGDSSRIREGTGRTVVFDFRTSDTAAGGGGAPLVPAVDAILFGDATEWRVALNLGGIANLTILPPGAHIETIRGFDCGPANMPIDTYITVRSDGRERYDRDGAMARSGHVDADTLATLRAHRYFSAPTPKSTGREMFGAPFIAEHRAALDRLSFADAMATLTELTAITVADAVHQHAPHAARVIASGGGVHNLALMDALARALGAIALETADRYGVNSDAKEALAFAVLGYLALAERPGNAPGVTGARGARILGAIAPFGLTALLSQLRAEESAG